MKKKYNFISRLINKITLNSQSNNDSFSYYGHWVELQSGTVDYMSVTIYNTSDRYSGTLVEFQFDFWTMELCFDAVSCDEVYDTVVKAFKGVYYNRRIRVIEQKPYYEMAAWMGEINPIHAVSLHLSPLLTT